MSSRSAPFLKARYSDNMYIRLLCRWHPLYCQEVPAMDRGRMTQTRPLSYFFQFSVTQDSRLLSPILSL